MLEKPTDLSDDQLRGCLRADYGLTLVELAFLPLGADVNTAVYRAVDAAGAPYFVKLRRGAFDAALVWVPQLLRERGVTHVIAPLPTRARRALDADGGLHRHPLSVCRGRERR